MTKLTFLCVVLALFGREIFAQSKPDGLFCKKHQYPSGISVGQFGEIHLECSDMECSHQDYGQPKCSRLFFEMSCKENQWIGGVAPSSNLKTIVPVQCCDVPALAGANNRLTEVISLGGRFAGEQMRDKSGNLLAYDVIKNTKKISFVADSYALEVQVARLSCRGKGPSLDSAQLSLQEDPLLDRIPAELTDQLEGAPQLPPQIGEGELGGFGPQQELPQLPGGFGPQQALALLPVPAGGVGGAFCFTGDTTVQTPTGSKTMDKLRVGDHVLTLEDGFQQFLPIISFIHRLPHQKHVKYQKIVARDGMSLKLTPQHFIYAGNCAEDSKIELKYAQDVRPGDCWIKVDSDRHALYRVPIKTNTVIYRTGAYAPLTENGVMVTDGILASCHSVYKNENFMDTFVYWAAVVKNALGGLFDAVGARLPEGTTELPWLVKYGQAHLDKLLLVTKY